MHQRFIPRLKASLNRVPTSLLSIQAGAAALLVDLWIGIGGFMLIEGYKLTDAFYMTIITLSTVGYTEVEPLTNDGKIFASLYIMVNVGLFAYILSVFSYYVIQGELFKNLHLNMINSEIAKLDQHVILCGYGRYGKEASSHLLIHNIPFVVIDQKEEEIENLQRSEEKILYIHGDATQDELLNQAGIKHAATLITALSDDTDNLFIVLTARQLNPNISIISRASNVRTRRKLELAGASHVVMPEQIGGFYMATLVTKPGAVEFFYYITREYESDMGFEEILYENLPEAGKGISIRDLHLRKETGCNIIGFKHADGQYEVNPDPDTMLSPGTSFIVLGSRSQLRSLKAFWQNYPSG